MPVYTIHKVPDKGVHIKFAKGDIQEMPQDADKAALLEVVQTLNGTECAVIDLSETGRIGTRWIAWFARLTAEAKAGAVRLAVFGADDTTRKTADLTGANLNWLSNFEDAWKQ